MRVGYFGGTFDPPHLGHLAVAVAARDRYMLDKVLLAPTGSQPLKPGSSPAAYFDRLAMVHCLCEGESGLIASDIDGPHADGAPNYTIDTLRELRKQLGASERTKEPVELFVIVGADAFLDLPRWKDPSGLLQAADWIVVSRPGSVVPALSSFALPPHDPGRVHLLEDVAVPVSATEVRHRLAARESIRDLVPAAVAGYIEAHHLYGRSSRGPADLGTG